MITFMIICAVLVIVVLAAIVGIAVVGTVASGVLLIALDIAIGLAPFIVVGGVIHWLLKKR